MNTGIVERTESAPRLQAFEAVDKENADALWEAHEAYQAGVLKAGQSIRELNKHMVSLNDVSTILSCLSAKLYEAGYNEWADEIDVIAAEIEP